MNLRRTSIALLLVILGGAAVWAYYDWREQHPATADAYLGMHVVHIAAQVDGPVAAVSVRSHQAVKAGELLFSIDPTPFELAVREAQARLQQAEDALGASDAQVRAAQAEVNAARAALDEAQRHTARIDDLVRKGMASRDQGDSAQRALKDALQGVAAKRAELAAVIAQRGAKAGGNAAIEAARAAVDQAKLDLRHTRVLAPGDGIVGSVDLRPGSYVNTGQALMALVETREVWVDANFKETDLPRIRPGQSAQVTVDLLPGETFKGRVESLSPASGAAFALLPAENATGNWVKVTQRFPVRVRVLDPVPGLRVGASSEVTIDTGSNPAAAGGAAEPDS